MNSQVEAKPSRQSKDAGKVVYMPRLAAMLWVLFFPMAYTLLYSGPFRKFPGYLAFSCLALIPLIWGTWGYRTFGTIALILSLWVAVQAYKDGTRHKVKLEQLKQGTLERQHETNVPQSSASSRIP